MKILLIFLLLLLFVVFAYAEDPGEEQAYLNYKHSISLSYGVLLIVPSLELSYDYMIKEFKRSYLTTHASASYFESTLGGSGGFLGGASLHWIIGKKFWLHGELGLGAFVSISGQQAACYPDIYCGLRYQKPGARFFITFATGFPKTLSQGIGWTF